MLPQYWSNQRIVWLSKNFLICNWLLIRLATHPANRNYNYYTHLPSAQGHSIAQDSRTSSNAVNPVIRSSAQRTFLSVNHLRFLTQPSTEFPNNPAYKEREWLWFSSFRSRVKCQRCELCTRKPLWPFDTTSTGIKWFVSYPTHSVHT